MGLGSGSIDNETFRELGDTDAKLQILFETIMDTQELITGIQDTIENRCERRGVRLVKLENRKKFDRGASFVGGIIGGVGSFFSIHLFGKGGG
jgi:hypothetical protein